MKSTSNFDINLGKRIKHFRVLIGYTRKELAKKLRITQQQLQKYEKGKNRIAVSRLNQISLILDLPISRILDEKTAISLSSKDRLITDIMNLVSGIKDKSGLLSLKNLIMAFVSRA